MKRGSRIPCSRRIDTRQVLVVMHDTTAGDTRLELAFDPKNIQQRNHEEEMNNS